MIKNRIQAGKLLAEQIREKDSIVLAIPRGGVVVGAEIAKKLECSLDVVISKKITPPDFPEYAIGAITHEGTIHKTSHWEQFSNKPGFKEELEKKQNEVKRRLEEYRGSSSYALGDKSIILVDDGIATGATVFAILEWLSSLGNKIILAIPVIPSDTYEKIQPFVSEIIAIEIPCDFSSVGQFYEEFEQVSDEQVKKILKKAQNHI